VRNSAALSNFVTINRQRFEGCPVHRVRGARWVGIVQHRCYTGPGPRKSKALIDCLLLITTNVAIWNAMMQSQGQARLAPLARITSTIMSVQCVCHGACRTSSGKGRSCASLAG